MSESPARSLFAAVPALAPVGRALSSARAWLRGLSKPARILAISTLVLSLGIGGFVLYQTGHETWTPLFGTLDREDAAAVILKLKEAKVPYKIGVDGTTIEVPETKVHELRLELAGSGLPRGGGVGFESFDKMHLGTTDFEQRVLFRRAMEGELARTMATIESVESARVHLVLPERSVFVSRAEPASASIVIHLKPGRTIGPAQVNAIVHLTASSVPGLTAEAITLVTTDGMMLHRPRKTPAADGSSSAPESDEDIPAARLLESTLEERARAMVERIVGPGHADVRVSADLDNAKIERVEDRYGRDSAVLRSEERTVERTAGGSDDTVSGVPGAESNLPSGGGLVATPSPAASATPAPTAANAADAGVASAAAAIAPAVARAAAAGSGVLRESATRNFEINHVSEKRTQAPGAVRRLAVAVVLDGIPDAQGHGHGTARSREELDKVQKLVSSAVGIDATRGDALTVESIPFLDGEVGVAPPPPAPTPFKLPLWTQTRNGRIGGGVGAGVLVLLMVALVLRSRRSRKAARSLSAKGQTAGLLSAAGAPLMLTASDGTSLPALDAGPRATPEELRSAAHERARLDPATAALILRAWLGTTSGAATDDRAAAGTAVA